MALNNQIKMFSVNTHAFYTDAEKVLYKKLSDERDSMKCILEWLKLTYLDSNFEDTFKTYNKKRNEYVESKKKKESEHYQYFKEIANTIKVSFKKQSKNKMTEAAWINFHNNEEKLKKNELFENHCEKNVDYIAIENSITINADALMQEIKKNKETTRALNNDVIYSVDKDGNESIKLHKQISVFTSFLTDTLGLSKDELCNDVIVVKTKTTEIMEQLVKNDFYFGEDKFIFLTSSSGQIRVKKCVFIKENVFEKHIDTLMCGLSKEIINNEGGINPNKYLSYLALCNSSCDIIEDFDIDKAIVVPDFSTEVEAEYDLIDKDTMEIIPNALESKGKIKIVHSDGCGLTLYNENNTKAYQFRMGWFKGLMIPTPYLDFCKRVNNYLVEDIYGKTWDLLKSDIQYIFSISQFKMYKYYKNTTREDGSIYYGWDKYKDAFKKYNCKAGKLNEEPDKFVNKSINYQCLQTLTDFRPDEIDRLTEPTINKILKSYTDTKSMLNTLGASDFNTKITAEQLCLKTYPALLRDFHFKDALESAVASMKKDAKGGSFIINAKSTFIAPDVYAWMECLIGKNSNPKGILESNSVYCKLFNSKKYPQLACLRSPHLYREWAIMNNIDKGSKWFCTNALYVNCNDLLSKLIMNDWDGDSSLVVADHDLINIGKRNMEGINPLYYEMGTAKPINLDNNSIWDSLKSAWKYGNIGKYSNKLTKLWNNPDPDLDIAAIICFLNNSSIDAAKTNFMPKVKNIELKQKISAIEKLKLPHFFQFCKDYDNTQVAPIGESTMDKICAKFELIDKDENGNTIKHKYLYGNDIGKFNYKNLLNNKNIKKTEIYNHFGKDIIKKYEFLNEQKNYYFKKIEESESNETEKDFTTSDIIWKHCMEQLKSINKEISENDLSDILVSYVFTGERKGQKKTLVFKLFGNIILNNLRNNIAKPLDGDNILCSCCGKPTKKKSNRQKMCPDCSDKTKAERNKNRNRK